MILTVTLNPSVDISYYLDELELNGVNRAKRVSKTAGGKGLNVSKVVHELGEEVMATGFLGGTIGDFIRRQLDERGIRHSFYEIAQESRNCIAILHEGKQTEVLEAGPVLGESEEKGFLDHFRRLLVDEQVEVVVISGSAPRGISSSLYERLIEAANERTVPVILDASGNALESALANPQLQLGGIKPNLEELEAVERQKLETSLETLLPVLEARRYERVEWLLVSMGKEGAFLRHGGVWYQALVPAIQAVSPVGSGDATVAGMAVGVARKLAPGALLRLAMAAGVLNALEEETGHVDASKLEEVSSQIKIESLHKPKHKRNQ